MVTETTTFNGYEIQINVEEDGTNPSLHINGKMIPIEYDVHGEEYYSHLFYRTFESIMDLAVSYIKNNPDLLDIHPGHHE